MLPNSRAWKLLCKLYGSVLQDEWRRRTMEKGAVAYFADAAKDLHEARARRTGGGIMAGCLEGVRTLPLRAIGGLLTVD